MGRSLCEGVVVVCFATFSHMNCHGCVQITRRSLCEGVIVLYFRPLRLTCPPLPAPVTDDICVARYVKRACPLVRCTRPSLPALWKHGCPPLRLAFPSGRPRLETCLAGRNKTAYHSGQASTKSIWKRKHLRTRAVFNVVV